MYKITIADDRDHETLCWLADHGYDGDFMKLADLEEHDEETGKRIFTMSEVNAWAFNDYIRDDPDAFLACNGSVTLNDSLVEFWQSIV